MNVLENLVPIRSDGQSRSRVARWTAGAIAVVVLPLLTVHLSCPAGEFFGLSPEGEAVSLHGTIVDNEGRPLDGVSARIFFYSYWAWGLFERRSFADASRRVTRTLDSHWSLVTWHKYHSVSLDLSKPGYYPRKYQFFARSKLPDGSSGPWPGRGEAEPVTLRMVRVGNPSTLLRVRVNSNDNRLWTDIVGNGVGMDLTPRGWHLSEGVTLSGSIRSRPLSDAPDLRLVLRGTPPEPPQSHGYVGQERCTEYLQRFTASTKVVLAVAPGGGLALPGVARPRPRLVYNQVELVDLPEAPEAGWSQEVELPLLSENPSNPDAIGVYFKSPIGLYGKLTLVVEPKLCGGERAVVQARLGDVMLVQAEGSRNLEWRGDLPAGAGGTSRGYIRLRADIPLSAQIPGGAADLSDARWVAIGGSKLHQVPPELFNLPNLLGVDLSGGGLTALPTDLTGWANIRELRVSYTGLTKLPAGIGALRELRTLVVNHSKLESVPPELGRLRHLETLDLRINRLGAVPREVFGLERLEVLNLANNRITSLDLPVDFGHLTRLRYLSLGDNALTTLPEGLAKLQGLQHLEIWSNPLPAEEVSRVKKILPHCNVRFH